MNVLYRIYTEEKPNIRELVATRFDGFTLIPTEGCWKGASESSVIVEVVGDALDAPKIRDLAEAIRVANHQEAVMVTKQEIDVEFVVKPTSPAYAV